MQPLIVFSHVRWDGARQRPQHLMARLAQHYRVFFIEEPLLTDGRAFMHIREPAPNVRVCQPHTAVQASGFHDDQLAVLQPLIENLICTHELTSPIAWLTTPMALPLLQRLDAQGVVYDCGGELGAAANAPRQLAQREHALLKAADVVFTAGRSLYRARQALHDHVYCIAGSVERAHFESARDAAFDHPDQRGLPPMRLGYFGVIDERLDLVTLGLLADAQPDWQVVLVGAVRNIDPASLPQRPNIHYFGERDYQELPAFVAGWDACLLPFAMNEFTRHANPGKILEYMAAEKPIVVSPVPDIVEAYGHIVHVGRHSQGFVAACERALTEPAAGRQKRVAMMRNIVNATSWDAAAEKVHHFMEDSLAGRSHRRTGAQESLSAPQRKRAIVVGAGPTGLSAAYHLGADCLLLEQHDRIGGGCRSIEDEGFTFDHGGHVMFSDDAEVHEMYRMLLGTNVHWQGVNSDSASTDGNASRDADAAERSGTPVTDESGANRLMHFGYPLRGGFQAMMNGFSPLLRGEVRLRARVSRVLPSRHLVALASGESFVYDKLVSTMPLPVLIDLVGDEAPTRIRKAASLLRQYSVRVVNLGVAREKLSDAHWSHYPPDTVFHRIFMQGNASVHNNAPGGFALTCEIGYSPEKPLPCDGEALIDRCIADCVKVGIIDANDAILVRNQVDIPYAYVVEDEARAHSVELIRHWLAARDIVIAGRYGSWQPVEHDHAFVAGREAAEKVEAALQEKFRRPSKSREGVAYLVAQQPPVAPAPNPTSVKVWQAPLL